MTAADTPATTVGRETRHLGPQRQGPSGLDFPRCAHRFVQCWSRALTTDTAVVHGLVTAHTGRRGTPNVKIRRTPRTSNHARVRSVMVAAWVGSTNVGDELVFRSLV